MFHLLIEEKGSALVLTLNRPEVLNALSMELTEALLAAVKGATERRHIRTIIITGAGTKAFSAGTDLKQRRDFCMMARAGCVTRSSGVGRRPTTTHEAPGGDV